MYQFDLAGDPQTVARGSPVSLLFENICRVVIDEGIVVCDTTGKPVCINRAAKRMCTSSLKKADPAPTSLLKRIYRTYEVSNEEGERIPQEDHPLALSRQLTTFSDYLVRLKDRDTNRLKHLRFTGDRIYDQSGDLRYFVTRIHNVTAKKECEVAVQDENEHLHLLSETIADLLLSEDPLAFLDTVYQRLSDHLDLEVYFHFQITPDDHRLELAAYQGVSKNVAASLKYLEFGEAVCGTVAANCSRIIAEDVQDSSDRLTALIRELGITAYICHPLVVRGRLLGTLSFGTRTASTFSSSTVELIRALSDQMAVALYTIELRDRTREISNKLVQVEEEERRRLARELHDELGGELSLLKQHLLTRNKDHKELVSRVDTLIRRVRSLTLDLRPAALDEVGLVLALEQFIDRFTDHTGINVDFVSELSDDESCTIEQAVVLYRLVQEALTNVARHAATDTANVSLHKDDDEVSVHVIDEGVGFNLERLSAGSESSGLQNMKERIELMDGEFFVDSTIGEGTHISAVLKTPLA